MPVSQDDFPHVHTTPFPLHDLAWAAGRDSPTHLHNRHTFTCAVAPAGVQLREQRGALGAAAGGAQLVAQLSKLGESEEPQVGNGRVCYGNSN